MKNLFFLCLAFLMSCTSTPSQKSTDMQQKAEIIISESHGGKDEAGFAIISNEEEFKKAIKENSPIAGSIDGKEPEIQYPAFPKDRKVILYNLGTFNSGDHRITQIKSISLKNNILHVEVPEYESGGMVIQVISNPWMIFTVPSNYNFNSVELKYSK